jgi:predicted dehydrogenase
VSTPLRIGLLSTARINNKVLVGARQSDAVTVLGVASRDPETAHSAAADWDLERHWGSYDELLGDPDVDAVYIPLPNGMHHAWTLAALDAGKHVLCEKPYSADPADVIEAFDRAEARGLVLSEAFMFRYSPQIVRLVELLASGVIGTVRLIRASFGWLATNPDDIRLDSTLAGGALMDVGCYCVSAARLVAGEPTSVTAQALTLANGVDVGLVGTMRFADDVLACFDTGLNVAARSQLEVVGTHGSITVSDPWHGRRPGLVVQRPDADPEALEMPAPDSYRLELDAFAAAVAGDRSVVLGRADALGQAATLEALYRSAASGQTVALRAR